MDDYYSNLTVNEGMDNEEMFKAHVVRGEQQLEEIDNLLNRTFSTEMESGNFDTVEF